MVLKMKNVNIMRVHQFLEEGVFIKKQYIWEISLDNLQEAWQKIERGVFLRGGGEGFIPRCTLYDLILVHART